MTATGRGSPSSARCDAGSTAAVLNADFQDLQEQWVEGRPELRWRSTLGTTPAAGAAGREIRADG